MNLKKISIVLFAVGLITAGCERNNDNNPPEITDTQIEQAYQEIKKTADEILLSDDPIAGFEAIAQEYRQKKEVKEVEVTNDGMVVEFENGFVSFWTNTPFADMDSEDIDFANKQRVKATSVSANNSAERKLGFIVQISKTDFFKEKLSEKYNKVLAEYRNRGWDTPVISCEQATQDFFLNNLNQYDALLILTHGGIYNNTIYIATGELISDWKNFWGELTNPASVITVTEKINGEEYAVSYKAVTANELKTSYSNKRFKNTFIYTSACHGLQNTGLADAFTGNGAVAFMGWNETNCLGFYTGGTVFQHLLENKTVHETREFITSLKHNPDQGTPAEKHDGGHPATVLNYYPASAADFRLVEPKSTAAYSSDFNNNIFDTNFWTKDLGSNNDGDIRVEDGVMKLEQNSTDLKTNLLSKELNFGNSITMERDVFLSTTKHYWSGGGGANKDEYFYAETVFHFDNGNTLHIGYHYDCWHSYDNPYFHNKYCYHINYADGSTSGDWIDFPLETILDSWFHEKIVLNRNGKLQYYINNAMLGEYNIGNIASNASSYHLLFNPTGWWTVHKHYFDNFKISGL
ncbi:MAG: hypothetical protein LBH19_12080 [Dysgonamonadaceae bacterium]|jgi:hypothetical protein|nr:hypothetical protein [Dysgonamonadaceae bacterium]